MPPVFARNASTMQVLFSCTIAEYEQILQSQWKVNLCFAVFSFPFFSQVYITAVGKYPRFVYLANQRASCLRLMRFLSEWHFASLIII